MRLYFKILLAFVGLLAASPVSAQTACGGYIEPSIDAERVYSPPQFQEDASLRDILAMSGEKGQESYARHEPPVGFTATSLVLETSYEVTSTNLPNGIVCAQITQFHVKFGFDPTIVYLASELPEDSCAYQVIRGHELRHVATTREIMEAYLPQLPGIMATALRRIGTVRAGSQSNAEQRIKYILDNYVRELAANIATVHTRRQALIDTQDEYRRISESCNGAISAIVTAAGE